MSTITELPRRFNLSLHPVFESSKKLPEIEVRPTFQVSHSEFAHWRLGKEIHAHTPSHAQLHPHKHTHTHAQRRGKCRRNFGGSVKRLFGRIFSPCDISTRRYGNFYFYSLSLSHSHAYTHPRTHAHSRTLTRTHTLPFLPKS